MNYTVGSVSILLYPVSYWELGCMFYLTSHHNKSNIPSKNERFPIQAKISLCLRYIYLQVYVQ